MRRLPEVIGRQFRVPVLQLNVPRTRNDDSTRRLFRADVRWLRAELEQRTGSAITGPGLGRQMLEEEEKRSLLRALNELRRRDCPLVRQSDILALVRAAGLLSTQDCAALLRHALIREGSRAGPATGPHRPRLMLAGSIVAAQDLGIVSLLEEQADIVADMLSTGTRAFRDRIDVPLSEDREELLDRLADFYFDRTGVIQLRPNDGYYRQARSLIADYRVAGIVFKTLLFCDAYGLEARRLERELGLPLLHLDADYTGFDQAQLRTRVEAFLEALAG
jgi:benzoyl-CoA reductase/2-hydroxyglutaryl-CoA dehydratase subunit BcrC/BadD/HgdB